jgi:FAD/FMN-containing dehydrogenase
LPSALSFAPASSAAYPPRRDRLYLPTNIYFAWALPLTDESVRDGARKSTARLVAKAQELGQDLSGSSTYANYAIEGTPLEQIYGANLPRLKALKKVIDPENVMGLAGGWKF